MKSKDALHHARVVWTGDRGEGTAHYRAYDRTWDFASPGKMTIPCSNDPALGGDPAKHNPEDMLLAALASCHMLWWLHLAAMAGVVCVGYEDAAEGAFRFNPDGSGEFTGAVLRPVITLSKGAPAEADALHEKAHAMCYIARSVNFPLRVEATYRSA